MKTWEVEELANTNIGEKIEFEEHVLIPEEVKTAGCEDCFFIGRPECHHVPCSGLERMDGNDCVYVAEEEVSYGF